MVTRYLSVCSGIEAFSVAVADLDFKAVAFSEIEDFPSKVLAYRFPDVPNLGDFTAIDTDTLGEVGWLVGGTPCQSFSVAGLRKGLSDERGNLTLEYVRLAHALQEGNGLRGLLWENVPGVLSDKSNAFGCFLGAIVGHDGPLVTPDGGRWPDAGMVAGPRARLAWRILDSQYLGVPQRRRRVFVVVDFGNGPDPAAVLFEPGSQGRGFEASGEAGQEIAGTIGGSSQSGGFRTTDLDNNGAFIVAAIQGSMLGRADENSPAGSGVRDGAMFTLTKADRHAVAVYAGNAEGGNQDAPSLNASNGKKGINNQTPLVTVNVAPVAFGSKGSGLDAGDISPTLRASWHDGSHPNGGSPPAIAFSPSRASSSQSMNPSSEIVPTLDKSKEPAIQSGQQVRRLLPIECERLQAFPDNWTLIPGLSGWRDVGDDESVAGLEAAGLTVKRTKKSNKLRVNDPDGPRYKALGNSFTVSTVRWIMRRVEASMAGKPVI